MVLLKSLPLHGIVDTLVASRLHYRQTFATFSTDLSLALFQIDGCEIYNIHARNASVCSRYSKSNGIEWTKTQLSLIDEQEIE